MQPAIILLHSSDATGAACTTARRASQCRAPACLIWSTNTWTPRSDEPPPCNAARAFSFQPAARRAIAAASNPPIASSTRSRRASLVSGVGARTPTRCTSTRNLALMRWSDHLGEVTTGLLRRAERREERQPEQWEGAAGGALAPAEAPPRMEDRPAVGAGAQDPRRSGRMRADGVGAGKNRVSLVFSCGPSVLN